MLNDQRTEVNPMYVARHSSSPVTTVMHLAINNVNGFKIDCLRVLLSDPRIHINTLDQYGKSAFHKAVELNNLEAIEAFLADPRDVDIPNSAGEIAVGRTPEACRLLEEARKRNRGV